MTEFDESYRPTKFDVEVAKLKRETSIRLGKPVPSWVHEVLDAAERNGIAPIKAHSA